MIGLTAQAKIHKKKIIRRSEDIIKKNEVCSRKRNKEPHDSDSKGTAQVQLKLNRNMHTVEFEGSSKEQYLLTIICCPPRRDKRKYRVQKEEHRNMIKKKN